MANIIDIITDRCLQLSGSEAFYRKMDLPSGSSDIRFGMMASITPASSSTSQTFSPAISLFETMMMGFVSQTGSVPLYTSGVSSMVVRSSTKGTGDSRSNSSLVGNTSYSSSMIQSPNGWESWDNAGATGSWYSAFPNTSMIIPTPSPCNFCISWVPDKLAPFIVRAYKSATVTDLWLESRSPATWNVNDGAKYSSMTPTQIEDYLRDCLTNPASTSQQVWVIFRFNTQADRDAAFDQLTTVFFGWPFYNVLLNIHCMGYRAV